MAEYEFYPLGRPAEQVKAAVDAAANLYETSGVVFSDGNGQIRMAAPGADYGYPMLSGNGVPTVFVPGALGQFYYNLAAASAPYLYVCVDQTQQGYQWEAVGGSSSGFRILGYYNTLELMQNSVTQPSAGDAYGIGTAAPYTIYVFDGLTHTWKNNGTLGVGGVSNGIPPHGSTGQALIKRSEASGDVEWGTPPAVIPDGSVTAAKLFPGAISADRTVTIPVSAWSGIAAPYTAAVAVAGILATDAPIIDLIPNATLATAEAELEAWGTVYRATTMDGTVTFYATDKPTVALTVQLKAVTK